MADLPIDPSLLMSHIRDGLLLVDTDGRVLWCNDVFRTMIGRPGEDLAGHRCCELGVGSFCAAQCPVHTEGGGSCEVNAHFNVQVEARGEAPGQPGAYCFVTTPVRDDGGKVIGYLENFRGMDRVRDVILQLEDVVQAVDAERHKTENLIDSMADGVFSVDQDLRIRRFSRNMEQMLGIAAENAVGKPCREVLRGTKCDTDCPLVWSRENGGPVTGCTEDLTAADGRSIPVQITTGLLQNEPDFERGLFGVVTDRSEVESLRQELETRASFHGMIGVAPASRVLFQQIEAVAPTEATVLVMGESGTGKELVARAIHDGSARARGPFVGVNCAALVEELLESELFGHVRGAFTGAVKDREGKFEAAEGGTLFLDEVGDTSPALQAKLLRALQEKTVEPVGSGTTRKVDVRIVAATNKDLAAAVAGGKFREDLYYRLNVIPIVVPPLRDRREDVPPLVDHFIRKYRPVHYPGSEESFSGISERALSLMVEYGWPGNIRELEHAVEYAMISSDAGRIERAFLPAPIRAGAPVEGAWERHPGAASAPPAPAVEDVDPEKASILSALEARHWSVHRAAQALGVSRTTLWRKMKRLGIERA